MIGILLIQNVIFDSLSKILKYNYMSFISNHLYDFKILNIYIESLTSSLHSGTSNLVIRRFGVAVYVSAAWGERGQEWAVEVWILAWLLGLRQHTHRDTQTLFGCGVIPPEAVDISPRKIIEE